MDLAIFQAINNVAGRWHWLDLAGIFFASGAGYVLVAVLVVLWFLKKDRWRMIVVSFLSAGIARGILVTLIRFFYHRPRPISVDAVHRLVVNNEWAFPSGHAAFFFALSTGVYLYNKKLGIVFYIVSLLMGVARIFIGVHWPSDILGGAILGIFCGVVVGRLARPTTQEL